jgi:catechol 2,3-dioxygenase-like lactoylglutathione lyase family enzyme
MGDLTVYGFNHTAFVVVDLDRTIGFFQDLLGFELASRAPRDPQAIEGMTGIKGVDIEVAYLRGFGQWIELIRYLAPADRGQALPRVFQDGAGHVAFDIADIDAAVAAADGYGLTPVGEIVTIDQGPNKGRKVVYLQSDDGLSIEFIEVPFD